MAYTPQFYPGSTSVGINRRKHMSGNLEKLPELFDISRATIRTVRQNLTWALFYNLVSIPVAALGVLHPSICATAMSASSIGVLMHSLRLKDGGKKERRFPWKKKS